MSRSNPDIAWAPLRATPLRFRVLLVIGGILVAVGYTVLVRQPTAALVCATCSSARVSCCSPP